MTMEPCSVPECRRPVEIKKHGLCRPDYQKLRKQGIVGQRKTLSARGVSSPADYLEHRGWNVVARVDGLTECWEWTHANNRQGYGMLDYPGIKARLAHRFAYEAWVGTIPDGMAICHQCDNPPCIRPEHLFPGSLGENAADCKSKDRHTRGERVNTHVLTAEQVLEIRANYVPGQDQQMAAEYGVSPRTIDQVARRQTWKHLP